MKQNPQSPGNKVLRKIGILLLNFALFYALLRLVITLAERTGQLWIYYAGTVLYALFGAGCFVAFYVLNGFTFNREERTIDELPEKWSSDRKMEFLGKQTENKQKARRLVYVILPMLLTLAVSYIELTFFK